MFELNKKSDTNILTLQTQQHNTTRERQNNIDDKHFRRQTGEIHK